jgi:SEC-C motif-containing protein
MKRGDTVDQMCPCGVGLPYVACCGRWHAGPDRLKAPDAPALMRSRYTAFVLDDLDYLLDTWHASTRPITLDPNPPGMQWLGLELRAHASPSDDHATVEFVARSKFAGRAQRMHEVSRFTREDGIWQYVDGDFPKAARRPAA